MDAASCNSLPHQQPHQQHRHQPVHVTRICVTSAAQCKQAQTTPCIPHHSSPCPPIPTPVAAASPPTFSSPSHSCMNPAFRSVTMHSSSRWQHSYPWQSLALCLMLLLAALLPGGYAMGPRILASEYEVRQLRVGTIQHPPSDSRDDSTTILDTPPSSDTSPSSAPDDALSISWRSYEFASIDLIFDQPLYVHSAQEIERKRQPSKPRNDLKDRKEKGAALRAHAALSQDHNGTSSQPDTASTATRASMRLEGAIMLSCASDAGQHWGEMMEFPLSNRWNGSSSDDTSSTDDGTAVDYWDAPHPTLLPFYSAGNSMKHELIRLYDDSLDASDARRRQQSGILTGRANTNGGFTTTSSLFAVRESMIKQARATKDEGQPNVLSLLIMMAHSNETHHERFIGGEEVEGQRVQDKFTSPLDHCRIRYIPIATRQDQLKQRAEHLILLRDEEAAEQRQGRSSSDDSDSALVHLKHELEESIGQVSGVTNFKGYEVDAFTRPLTPRRASTASNNNNVASPFASRTIMRFDPDVERTLLASIEDEFKHEDVEEERLYAHSPLEDERKQKNASKNVEAGQAGRATASSSPDAPATSPSSSPLPFNEDDPLSTVFLSVDTSAQFVSLIMKPVMNGVMKPATAGTVGLLMDSIMTVLGENMWYSVEDEVAPDLAVMLGLSAQANVSNILQDSLTYAITKSLAEVITDNVGPYVSERLINMLPGPLHSIIQTILELRIPHRLQQTMPVILSRVLGVTLTHSLTRSIPHIVVPSISLSLGLGHAGSSGRPRYYHEVCMECYLQSIGAKPANVPVPPDMNPEGYQNPAGTGSGQGPSRAGSECGACPTSTYSMYYGIYHATHYTDYYSEYYAEYYSQAMQMTDQALYKASPYGPGAGKW